MAGSGILAGCSHCAFSRRFSPDLGGRFYRCPRCRQGVIAVPRPSAEEAERWRSSAESWLREERAAREEREERAAQRGPRPDATRRTPPSPWSGEGPGAGSSAADQASGSSAADAADPASGSSAADPAPGSTADQASTGDAASGPRDHKGEVATVRTILVECGLCGFLVRIPPGFFGKTVHCPECRGDAVFSESALEPVKDELFDRMALETAERDVLFRPRAEQPGRLTTLRSFLVGVGLGLLAIGLVALVMRARREAAREAAVEHARRDGWRWATTPDDRGLLHEPWCADLVRAAERFAADDARAFGLRHHECR